MSDKDQKNVKLAGIITGAVVLLAVVAMLILRHAGATGTPADAPGVAGDPTKGPVYRTPQEQALQAEDRARATGGAQPAPEAAKQPAANHD
jgi:hypothetical protein